MPANDRGGGEMVLSHADFVIPLLQEERQALDLSNSLLAVSGLSAIRIDLATHRLSIDYDAGYLSLAMMRTAVTGSGYPLAEGS